MRARFLAVFTVVSVVLGVFVLLEPGAALAKPSQLIFCDENGHGSCRAVYAQTQSTIKKSSKSKRLRYAKTTRESRRQRVAHRRAAPSPTFSTEPSSFGSGLLGIAQRFVGTNPTDMRRLWCGRFVRFIAKLAGFPDHRNGDLAIAWRNYGRPAGRQPGAIAVMKGHVGIVADNKCPAGRVPILSGNHGHTTGYGCYPAGRIIAYRMPANA